MKSVTFRRVLYFFLLMVSFVSARREANLFDPLWFALTFSSENELGLIQTPIKQAPQFPPQIVGGGLVLDSAAGAKTYITLGEGVRQDMRIALRFQLKMKEKRGAFSVILRNQTLGKSYQGIVIKLEQNPARNSLILKVIDRTAGKVLKSKSWRKPDELWHQMEVSLQGGRLNIYLDYIFFAKVNALSLGRGNLGLMVSNGAVVVLDDIVAASQD